MNIKTLGGIMEKKKHIKSFKCFEKYFSGLGFKFKLNKKQFAYLSFSALNYNHFDNILIMSHNLTIFQKENLPKKLKCLL